MPDALEIMPILLEVEGRDDPGAAYSGRSLAMHGVREKAKRFIWGIAGWGRGRKHVA